MKKSDSWFLDPTRQSALAILFIIYRVVKALVRGWWPILVVVFFQSERYEKSTVIYGLVALAIVIVVAAILNYLRFFFYLDGNQLHVEKGVLRRTRLDIPFDRIQSISLEQPLLHRIFRVMKVKIDTAGTSGDEFSFSALSVEKAETLKSILQQKLNTSQDHQVLDGPAPEEKLILNLTIADLLRIGVSQNHIRTAGIILFFFITTGEQVEDAIGDRFSDEISRFSDIIAANIWTIGFFFAVALILAAFLGTLIRTVSRYYDLKLWETSDGYRVNSGLLNRHEQVVARTKVQILRWNSNPIKRFFGIVAFRFYQASSDALIASKAITVPGCDYQQLDAIKSDFFGHQSFEPVFTFKVSRKLFMRRWFFLGWLPFFAMLMLFFASWEFVYFFLANLWLIISYWYQDRYHQTWSAWLTDGLLKTHSGVLENSTRMLEQFKVQGIKIRQTPFLRRNHLANIHFYTASGEVVVPYISYLDAIKAKNYFNFKVESSNKPWM